MVGIGAAAIGELQRIPRRLARSWTVAIGNVLAMLLVVLFVPFLTGIGFLDAFVVIPFACLSIFLVAILIAHSFAGDPAQHEILVLRNEGLSDRAILFGRVLAIVAAGWIFGLAMLAASLAFVNWMNWHGEWLLPSLAILSSAAALSLASAALVAAIAVPVALDATTLLAAQRSLRFGLLVTVIGILLANRYLPGGWLDWLARDLTDDGIAIRAWVLTGSMLILAAWLLSRSVRRIDSWSRQAPSDQGRWGRLA